jgi:hypothetical protein
MHGLDQVGIIAELRVELLEAGDACLVGPEERSAARFR